MSESGHGDTFSVCLLLGQSDSAGVVSFHNHHHLCCHFSILLYFDLLISRLHRPFPFFSALNTFFLSF